MKNKILFLIMFHLHLSSLRNSEVFKHGIKTGISFFLRTAYFRWPKYTKELHGMSFRHGNPWGLWQEEKSHFPAIPSPLLLPLAFLLLPISCPLLDLFFLHLKPCLPDLDVLKVRLEPARQVSLRDPQKRMKLLRRPCFWYLLHPYQSKRSQAGSCRLQNLFWEY